jgi:hypothetical protein
MRYQIIGEGESTGAVVSAFEEFELHPGQGVTTLVADLPNQAAVHGLINRVGGLGLGLIDFHRVDVAVDESGDWS